MFNGIIFNRGKVKTIRRNKKSILIGIESDLFLKRKDIGSSICCDGVCLTLVKVNKKIIYFYVSNETIKRSNFKNCKIGKIINIEKSLKYGQQISGHFTQGHVDTTARIKKISFIDKTWKLKLKVSNNYYNKFLVEKASISINGVSLTISKTYKNNFELNVIPHTLNLTNLKSLNKNDIVNVELDIFGKYMYKYKN